MIGLAKDRDGNFLQVNDQIFHVQVTRTISQQLHKELLKQKHDRGATSSENSVPKEYHDFKSVFDKASFDEMPPQRPWDHTIKLIPGAEPKSYKLYPMSPVEQKELDKFLDENLKTRRIRQSKLPNGTSILCQKEGWKVATGSRL